MSTRSRTTLFVPPGQVAVSPATVGTPIAQPQFTPSGAVPAVPAMMKNIHVARDGIDLGYWTYDVVIGMVRSLALLPTDHFWTEGMDGWESLESIVPPPLSEAEDYLRGRDDEDDEWAFYSRDGSTVVGPRSISEVGSMVDGTFLTERSQIFLPSVGHWMTIDELARFEHPADESAAPAGEPA